MKELGRDVYRNNSPKVCNIIINTTISKRYLLSLFLGFILFSSIYTTVVSGFMSSPKLKYNFAILSIIKDFFSLNNVYALSETQVDVEQDLEQEIKNCDGDICDNFLSSLFNHENSGGGNLNQKVRAGYDQLNKKCNDSDGNSIGDCNNRISNTNDIENTNAGSLEQKIKSNQNQVNKECDDNDGNLYGCHNSSGFGFDITNSGLGSADQNGKIKTEQENKYCDDNDGNVVGCWNDSFFFPFCIKQ